MVENSGKDEEVRDSVFGGRVLANPPPGEDIVISGLSGSFPESRDVYEFRDNLYNKVNMVTPSHRWEYNHPEIPACTGTLPEINKYDTGFFGVHERQSHSLDTLNRTFQEKAIEAIFDAGLHPSDLENTKTGVYTGACFSESDKTWLFENLSPQSYAVTGAERSMLSHRLSYFLKLKGPSFTTDTACSSSLYAFEHAYRALRTGEIDTAIVGGMNLCLHPFVSLQFARLGVLSPDGSCKAFDKTGNGYARSEAVGALILQRSKDARRIYAHVLHAKTNCDGYKPQGITYPSGPTQVALLNEFYDECPIDRYSLSYLEAHGTGTFVGDPEEGNAIDTTLAEKRKTPLLIGSVKSNIGHSEPVSGICSITKCIIGMEEGFIPPNIHFTEPREEIEGLVAGRMKVVTEKMPFQDDNGLVAINSFGFGGGNCHILLRHNKKRKVNKGLPKDNSPRLVCFSGRSEEAIVSFQDEIGANVLDSEHISLIHNVFRKNIDNHLYRGYVIVSKSGEIARSLRYCPESGTEEPLYITFGELNNWYDIGYDLLELPVFSSAIERIQRLISGKGINILDVLRRKSTANNKDHLLGNLAVQIGITDILKLLEVNSTATFGYSFGELPSAYYDGILNLEETVNYGLIVNEALNKADFKSLVKNYQSSQGNSTNGMNGNHLNGYDVGMEDLRSVLETSNLSTRKERWFQDLTKVLDKVKPWNRKTSKNKSKSSEQIIDVLIANSKDNEEECTNASCVVLKVGGSPVHGNADVSVLSFPSSDSKNYLVEFLRTVGSLYEYGYNPQIAKLYPPLELPVSRGTRMISPYIKWKHDRTIFVPQYNQEVVNKAQHGARAVKIQILDHEWSYIQGHVIDGRNLFPATGYLYLVWDAFSVINGVTMKFMNVVFENCKFIRATAMSKKGYLQFNITIQKGTGNFEVVEGDSPVVTGTIYMLENENDIDVDLYEPKGLSKYEALPLTSKDIYKELRLRGYHYKGEFRAVQECDSSASKGYIKWDNNWVTFMDNMLQLKILQTDSRLLYVPTFISKLTIAGRRHLEWIDKTYTKTDTTPNLPVINNTATNVISCGGIRLCGLIASSINRRKNLAVPVLESYKFIPNFATLNVEQSVRVNVQIILENALVYKVNVVELVDEFTRNDLSPLSPVILSVVEDQPLIQSSLKILSQTQVDVGIEVENIKKLNSETNLLLVIASNILRRPETLKEAFGALNENGYILSREPLDYDISTPNPGLTVLTAHRTSYETILLLQKQAEARPRTSINVTSTGPFSWVTEVQEAIKKNVNDDIVLYSEDEPNSGIVGLVNCLRREPSGRNIKCVFITESKKGINVKSLCEDQLKKNLAVNVYKNGQWGTYRHLLLSEVNEVECEHCYVNVTTRGDLSSLRWIQGPFKHDMSVPLEKILVNVYIAALNFRDVMTALGKVNVDVITQDRREQECVQGFEFAGRDQKGNRVMGMINAGALATVILSDPYLTFAIPDNWSMEEGATVITVYGTVIYALAIRANMKRGETILIHSGTGGIGQAAINFSLHHGLRVYTTVGTQEKREFLKKTFPQLKDCHIGNSRDESFEEMVYRETNGRGVDMVINSLAEDKLLASVRCLARGGRFLEIGKFDMASNNYLNTLLFRKEASFHGIMLDQLFGATPEVKNLIAILMREGIKSGAIKPLNTNLFNINEIEQAFRFMATGKHTGKVLVQVRKPEKELVAKTPLQKFSGLARYYCDPEKTYVIIGGLGGFGLELADWLVLRGAKKLVLTSRKGISTGYQNLRIRIWRSYGTIVKITKTEVTTKAGCRKLLEEALELGPIDAIFNLAVVLVDALFENQTPESFVTSFQPKAFATQYLDEFTRAMCPNLSNFVVFSSVSCGRGNAGQTNYGMANSVMERICEKRRRDGYPALAIEWGAIGEVGLVAEMQEEHIELEIGGTLQQQISNCLSVLDKLLIQQESAIVSSMVVAEKRGGAAAAANIVESVINILGLTDAKSVSLHLTLPELGMDSMTAVEIKQTLEREYEVFLTPKDIRTMTLARLKEMHEDKSGGRQSSDQKDIAYVTLDIFFRAISDEFESNVPCLRLKSNVEETSTASKVLLFPGIESVAKLYEPLSSQLNAHVVYIQHLGKSEEFTIQDMIDSVMPHVEEHVTKDEPFNVVAYSFGSIIALEVVSILESRGFTGKVTCIDGSPMLMTEMLNGVNSSEAPQVFETSLACHLLGLSLSPDIVSKYEESIFKCNSWDERVTLGIDVLKQYMSVNEDHQRNVANSVYWRINTLKSYSPSYGKLKSDILLCKTTQPISPGLAEDYNLSPLFEKAVVVQAIEGNHATILENESLATVIDSYIHSYGDKR